MKKLALLLPVSLVMIATLMLFVIHQYTLLREDRDREAEKNTYLERQLDEQRRYNEIRMTKANEMLAKHSENLSTDIGTRMSEIKDFLRQLRIELTADGIVGALDESIQAMNQNNMDKAKERANQARKNCTNVFNEIVTPLEGKVKTLADVSATAWTLPQIEVEKASEISVVPNSPASKAHLWQSVVEYVSYLGLVLGVLSGIITVGQWFRDPDQ